MMFTLPHFPLEIDAKRIGVSKVIGKLLNLFIRPGRAALEVKYLESESLTTMTICCHRRCRYRSYAHIINL